MDVWFCVTRRNRAERHNREVMNTLSETTTRSPERYGKALPHLTKTYHGSRLFVHSDWCRPVKTEADFTDESPTVDQFLRDSSELSSAIEERF
jgi:hypothetical protein